jgi:hypothetical protein
MPVGPVAPVAPADPEEKYPNTSTMTFAGFCVLIENEPSAALIAATPALATTCPPTKFIQLVFVPFCGSRFRKPDCVGLPSEVASTVTLRLSAEGIVPE